MFRLGLFFMFRAVLVLPSWASWLEMMDLRSAAIHSSCRSIFAPLRLFLFVVVFRLCFAPKHPGCLQLECSKFANSVTVFAAQSLEDHVFTTFAIDKKYIFRAYTLGNLVFAFE